MGANGNQNSWTPYDYRDCSLGICSIYCPQFCYFIFPPPPPPDDGGVGSGSPFSPLIIATIGVLASAFILVSYYTIVTRYCRRRRDGGDASAESSSEEMIAREQWAAAAATGLEEAAIKAIAVCEYREGDGLIEGTECAVCLSEFREKEALRLLPKCSHAFHLPCIDTWLKSHSSCPLCRAMVVAAPPPPVPRDDLVVAVEERREPVQCLDVGGGSGGGDEGEERKVGGLRRAVSLGRLPSQQQHVLVEVGDLELDLGRMRCQSWRNITIVDEEN